MTRKSELAKQKALSLKEVFACVDYGAINAWDEFSDEQKKEVNFWLLNRYVSSVKGSFDKQALAIFKTNEYYNKNWESLKSVDNKLKWQLLCISGNTKNIEFHEWIGHKKRDSSNSKMSKFLGQQYPTLKEDEIELLTKISTKQEVRELARDLGYDEKDCPV